MEACAKHDIPIVAYVQWRLFYPQYILLIWDRYSPIGRGLLTGEIKKPEDIPEGDFRSMMPRFSKENFSKNLELVEEVQKIAKKKGSTPAQVALAWVKHLSRKDGNPVIIPIPGATTEARVIENSKDVALSSGEVAEIDSILETFEVAGARYPEFAQAHLEG